VSDEIINFYKKAADTEEPQKPIEEQKETPAPVLPQPDEPFDKFLLELAEKLKNEKVITEKQQETFQEQIKQPVLEEDKNSDDPFKKFIGSFANILKQDELVNREENIKEATINFINKLKEQPEEPFIIDDQPLVKTKKKYLPPKIKQKVEKLPQVVKKKEPVVAEQADEPVKEEPKDENKYVQELKTADKSNKKIPEKIKSVSDIKSIVEKQVAEILSRYPNLGFTGGGGGTNAVQYAEGGTMRGDLNVTGKYLSGGVDLSTLIGSGGGGGAADRLVSGSASLILNPNGTLDFPNDTIRPQDETVLTLESENPALSAYTRIALSPYAFFAYDSEGNSITFDEVDNAIVLTSQDEHEWTFNKQGVLVGPGNRLTVTSLSSLGKILSGDRDLADIFLTSETDSQTLSFDDISEVLSISNGNSVALSSIKEAANNFTSSNFLSLSGGLVQGPVQINNNLTVFGNLTASGTTTFANTIFTTTSSLSVVHLGSGPALYVGNYGNDHIATFVDLQNNLEMLHIGGLSSTFPNVGIKTGNPNKDFTVQGEISATGTIWNGEGNSILWNTAYQNVSSQSLNINSEVQFEKIIVNPNTGPLEIDGGGLLWGGARRWDVETGILNVVESNTSTTIPVIEYGGYADSGNVPVILPVKFYAAIEFAGDDATLNSETTRNNLGLGSADNVELNQVNANVYLSGGINLLNILSSSGGGGGDGDPAVNTLVRESSAVWFPVERQFNFTTVGGVDISYSGTTLYNTSITSPTWNLVRLTYNDNGTVSAQASAYDSWTGRLTATYV
jgi:hypothetical protein